MDHSRDMRLCMFPFSRYSDLPTGKQSAAN